MYIYIVCVYIYIICIHIYVCIIQWKNTKQQRSGHVVNDHVSSGTVLHPRGFVPTTDINILRDVTFTFFNSLQPGS